MINGNARISKIKVHLCSTYLLHETNCMVYLVELYIIIVPTSVV